MHRQVGILVSVAALFVALLTAPMLAQDGGRSPRLLPVQQQAPQQTPRKPGTIELKFTDKQQDLAQEYRAMSAEVPNLLTMRDQIDKRLNALVEERQVWIKKVEAVHPGYKVIADEQGGILLEPVAAPPAAKK